MKHLLSLFVVLTLLLTPLTTRAWYHYYDSYTMDPYYEYPYGYETYDSFYDPGYEYGYFDLYGYPYPESSPMDWYADPAVVEAPYTVAVLGDSLARGVGVDDYVETLAGQLERQLTDHYGAAVAYTLGQSGATTAQVLHEQVPALDPLNPDIVLVVAGANDVLQMTSPEEYGRNLDALLTELERTGSYVVVTNIPALAYTPAVPDRFKGVADTRTQELNLVLYDVLAYHPNVELIDLYQLSAEELTTQQARYLSEDGFHPNAAGYRRMSEVILQN